MAQTITEIQDEIIATVQSDETLKDELTSTSSTALWRLWTYVVAFMTNKLQRLWDALKAEILDIISQLKPHSLRWYAEKAKAFQLGFPLLPDSDLFDNTGYTDSDIAASKIIKHVAPTEKTNPGGRTFLRLLIAGSDGTDLVQLPQANVDAVAAYFSRIKDAGVPVTIQSLPPDKIVMKWKVFYDATILTANGSRIDGTDSEPAKTAIKDYLRNLLFNGLYVKAHHVDAVQKVPGVVIPEIINCEATYGELPLATVNVEYQPDAGWMRFANEETDLEIEYIAHDVIEQ